MLQIFCIVLFFSLLNVAIYIILKKWGILEWLQFRVNQWFIPSECCFCLFSRLAWIELFISFYFSDWWFNWFLFISIIGFGLSSAVLSLYFLPKEHHYIKPEQDAGDCTTE